MRSVKKIALQIKGVHIPKAPKVKSIHSPKPKKISVTKIGLKRKP